VTSSVGRASEPLTTEAGEPPSTEAAEPRASFLDLLLIVAVFVKRLESVAVLPPRYFRLLAVGGRQDLDDLLCVDPLVADKVLIPFNAVLVGVR